MKTPPAIDTIATCLLQFQEDLLFLGYPSVPLRSTPRSEALGFELISALAERRVADKGWREATNRDERDHSVSLVETLEAEIDRLVGQLHVV